jgi:transglutaminase-like putative cysteine protease
MDVLIRHTTRYRYAGPVKLGRHRLMLRPRDSFDMRLIRTGLTIEPGARLVWAHDVYGNSIAWAYFSDDAEELVIDSELLLRRYQPAAPKPASLPWLPGAPVAYGDDERVVLQPFITPATGDSNDEIGEFAQSSAGVLTAGTDHPLMALATGIHRALVYRIRHEEGTQTPVDTLRAGSGSCRDYAWLFIECARRLGYAARFVTGYLHSGRRTDQALTAPSIGFSHAWAEVFVPGDGWVEFDPTNLLVADRQLVRVAVTRTPSEALPVLGSFTGKRQRVAPEVSVTVTAVEAGIPVETGVVPPMEQRSS